MCIHYEPFFFLNINSCHASVLLSPISACELVDCCSQHSVKQPYIRVFVLIFCTHYYKSGCMLVFNGMGVLCVAICVRKTGSFYSFFK